MKDRIQELKYIIENHPDNTHSTLNPFIPRLCADLGVSHPTVYRWVLGRQKPSKRHVRMMIPVIEKYLQEIKDLKNQGIERVKKSLNNT